MSEQVTVDACSIPGHALCSCRERCQLHRVTEIMGRPPLYYELSGAMSRCMVFPYPVHGIPHTLKTPPSHNLIRRQQLHLLQLSFALRHNPCSIACFNSFGSCR